MAVPATALTGGMSYLIATLGRSGPIVIRDRCCVVTGTAPTETHAAIGERASGQLDDGGRLGDGPISAFASG